MVVIWKRACITYFGKGETRVLLRPGSNVVPDPAAKALAEDKWFKNAIKDGAVQVLDVKTTKDTIAQDGSVKSPLEAYDLKGAKVVIDESFDPVFLKSVVDLEKRVKVREIAQARIDKLLEESKKDTGSQGEGAEGTGSNAEGGAAA